ncbi:penicillin-binding protein 1A [Thermodesulfobacteriota bacterium]
MKRIIKFSIWFMALIVIAIGITGGALWYIWSSNMPYIGNLREYNPPIITEIYSDDGEVIGRFWKEKRIVVSLEQLPDHLLHAFVAAEDDRFYEHKGVDFQGIFRALVKNLKAGKIEQGGSTITQQITRSLLLKNLKKTYKRKAREAILSLQIEKGFSKDYILWLYLNEIYLGQSSYGVEAAALTYFDKSAKDLTIAESAILAGLPQAPSRYSPVSHFDRAKTRQKYVLGRMREEGYITEQQEEDAFNTEIAIKNDGENVFMKAPYFTEYVRKYLEKQYGKELLYGGGLRVYTTVNLKMQQDAQAAIKRGLIELDKREGYKGPLRQLLPDEIETFKKESIAKLQDEPLDVGSILEGVVEEVDDENLVVNVSFGEDLGLLPLEEMKWARALDPEVAYYDISVKKPSEVLKPGDVILCSIKKQLEEGPQGWALSLEQEPEAQGAILSIESMSGRVRAMVGGRDFSVSQFDRANQARRQPGSAFKPIIYSAAIDYGMTPASIIIDSPYISTMNPEDDEEIWKPKNYAEKFYGPTLFRTALIKSRNVITVKILKTIGIDNVIEYSRKMGIESELAPDLSLALGSSGLSLMELTASYSVIANGGMLFDPFFINKIEDRNGNIIEENQPSMQYSIPEDTAFVMTDILKAAISEGTGWRAKALKRPAAGKTGTSNDLRDTWFMGFTPSLVTGVWVGYDDIKPMGKGETGSRTACPIWLYFMSSVLKEKPVEDFKAPEGVVFAKIDSEKGLLASPYSKKTVFQAFKKGTEPKKYTPKPEAPKSGQFLQFDMDFE